MARKPVQIDVASDTREFSKGVKDGVLGPLEDIVSALEDVDRDAGTTGQALEDATRDAAREMGALEDATRDAGDRLERTLKDAQRETEELKDDTRRLHDTIEKGARESYRKMGDAADAGIGDAMDVTGEFKDEAQSNWSELASSFDGSMDSIADSAQGVLGGLAGSLAGPVGIGAGLIAATGGMFYASWKENAEKTEQRISDMYDDMLESGANFLSREFIQQNLQDIYARAEDAVLGWEDLQRIVHRTGVTEEEVALAFAGDLTAQRELLDQLADKRDETYERWQGASLAQKPYVKAELDAVDKYITRVEGLGDEHDDAATRAQGYRDAVQRLNTQLYATPGTVETVITADTEQAMLRAEALDKRLGGLKSPNLTATVDTSEALRAVSGFVSDVEARRITLTVDARLTNHGRSLA